MKAMAVRTSRLPAENPASDSPMLPKMIAMANKKTIPSTDTGSSP